MRIISLALGITIVTVPANSVRAQGYTCHASDWISAKMIRHINASIADTIVRTRLGLPKVPAAQVVVSTDPTLCNLAGLAIDSVAHSQHPDKPKPPQGTGEYYVIKIGTYTGAARVNLNSSNDFVAFFVFSPMWELKSVVAM